MRYDTRGIELLSKLFCCFQSLNSLTGEFMYEKTAKILRNAFLQFCYSAEKNGDEKWFSRFFSFHASKLC